MAEGPMQLTEMLTLAVQHRLEKRAGIALPLTVGAMIPGVVDKAVNRAESAERAMEDAKHGPKTAALPPQFALPLAQMWQSMGKNIGGPMKSMGANMATGRSMAGLGGAAADMIGQGVGDIAAAPGKGIANGLSDLVQKKLFGQDIGQRQDAMGMAGGAALKSFGAEIGKSSVGLLRDIANKAMDAIGHAGDASARQAILGELKRTDSVLAAADDATLMESYHTMQRFAPTLSTDKNAVRSFLRQAVMSGTGPDFMTIKHLADSERAVTGEKRAAPDLHALLSAAAAPALGGAAIGGITGALSDKDDRSGGALRGALTGGAMGGLGGALHSHLNHAPIKQGPIVNTLRARGADYGMATSMGANPSGVPYDVISHNKHLRAVTPAQGDLAAALRSFSLQEG